MSETRLKGALLPLLPARDEHPKSAGPLGDGEVPSHDQAAAGPGYREKAALGGFGITEATAGVAGHRAAVDGAGGVGVREVKPDESGREVTSSRSAVAAAVNTAEVVPSLSADAAGQAEASALRARGVGDGAAHEPRRVMPSRGGHGATATEAPGRAGGAGDDAVSAAKAEAAAYTGGGAAAAIAAGEVDASTAAVAVSATGTSSSSSSSSAPGAAAVGAPAVAATAAGEAAAGAASFTSGGATGTSAPTAASATSVSPKAAPAAAATAAAAATTATAPATFEEAMATSAGAAVGPAGGAAGGSGAAGAAGRAACAAGGAGAAAGGAAGPAAGPAAGGAAGAVVGAAGGAACAAVAAGASGGAAVGAAGASAGAAVHVQASTHGGSERCGALERSVMDTSSPTRSPERSASQGDPASLDAEVKAAVKTNDGLDEHQAATTTTRGNPAVGGGTGGEATPLHKHQQQTAVAAKEKFPGQSIYHIKWIKWKGESTAIITQNENGPCPLLAIMNVLLLSWKIRFPAGMEIINAEQLMECLGDFILETMPKEFSEAQRLNYEQVNNISDAMTIMHKLQTGLDVNVRFTGVADFEYTPECIVFDLLGLPLYHGWLVDPQNSDVVKAVGKCSYNQLVEKIISSKQSQNSEEFSEGMVAELFLDSTATQLTYHGLCELNIHVKEAEICVFFRNNHFSTIYKHKGQLFLLVTDQGFLTEESVVWESLHSVDGDGNFCDSDFNLRPPSDPANLFPAGVNQEQIDQDYLVALSLQQEQGGSELPAAESDLDLAKRLQEEENLRAAQYFQEQERQQQPQQPPQPPQQPQQRQQQQPPSPGENRSTPAAGSAERERRPRRQEDKSKCVIL
ncbi:ubiquitin carboxyl-terminal hydrolase MINDY-2 isoform X1 [Lampetra planeri]